MTPSEIHRICAKYGIRQYTINDDMSISVEGDVNLSGRKLTQIPIKFKEVGGDFSCSYNQLTSLEGCPETVGGYFSCRSNKLISLKNCPETLHQK